ncbi:MAG TPA: hypothetical protein VIN58_09755 [Roseateles sp.]
MKKFLSRTLLGLLAGYAMATLALAADADPSSRSEPAGVIVNTPTHDADRPQPIRWDRLEKSSVKRTTRKLPAVALPADITETTADTPAERK